MAKYPRRASARIGPLALALGALVALPGATCDGDDDPPAGAPTVTCSETAAANADSQAAIASFYASDPGAYWSRWGFPGLARRAEFREAAGEEPDVAFEAALASLDVQAFSEAVEGGTLSAELREYVDVIRVEAPDIPMEELAVALIRKLVSDSDAGAGDVAPREARVDSAVPLLDELYDTAFGALGETAAPQAEKECADDAPSLLDDEAMDLCQLDCGLAENQADPVCTAEPVTADGPDDDDTTKETTTWDKITGVPWKTTYNPSCVGQSLGQCMAKLGVLKGKVTGKAWNDFGKAVGSVAGESGAKPSKQKSYVKGKGYCWTVATDGWRIPIVAEDPESACEEAKKALDRGCDVLFYWPTHAEMVTGISIDSKNDRKCTVSTSSWGKPATVVYDSGKAYNKSDKARYGDKSSVRKEGAAAKLVYICKC